MAGRVTEEVTSTVCMMGGLCCFRGTGCRSAAMVASLASSGPVRCKVVRHSYGTSLLEGLGEVGPTYDSAHSWRLYSAASVEHQTTGSMTCYPTQSHYPDTKTPSPCPILIMPDHQPRE